MPITNADNVVSGSNLGGTFTCLGMHGWCCVVEAH
jgi:hypothetical protein